MARSDLVISLVRAGASGDQRLLQQATQALAAEERAKHHNVFAEELETALQHTNGTAKLFGSPRPIGDFWHEFTPNKSMDDLVLSQPVLDACKELVEEHLRADILRSHNLEPRSRIILVGPPGNGKTSLAEAMAKALLVPIVTIRYDTVVGSFLGETASRLNKVFEYVRSRRCVLFFDEFDTLGKERGDSHDTGEIKRVVSSPLLQIDGLPSHVVVVTATNHPELLDRAVWRRFQLRLNLRRPSRKQIIEWLGRMEQRYQIQFNQPKTRLAKTFVNVSFAEIEEFGLSVARRAVLSGPDCDMKQVVTRQLRRWQERYTP
jgi:SpoVK/Ycf46/Vps4 family AAA+-type ATPase